MLKYILIFFISMIPVVELRGAIPFATFWGLDYFTALTVCVIGNMFPVPFIYFFARRVLLWGADRKYTGKYFRFFLDKGERGGQKLTKKTGRGGLFVALMLFVGIPLPGTGAWTGSLIASLFDVNIKKAVLAELLGIVIATIIMSILSYGLLDVIMGWFA